jgi:molecular chaperone GrpE
MNSDDKVDQIVDNKPEPQGGAKSEGGVEGDSTGSDSDNDQASTAPEDLATRLEEAETQIEALKDQALRGQAEAENARRRAGRDVENAHKFALERFSSDLLPVVDSLEKAVEAATAQSNSESGVTEGVELSLKLFLDVLEKYGISRIDPQGEPFDPQHHEAMAMVENPDAEPNSVLDVMQKGYSLNGRLVRAAMVVVSKAPAASSTPGGGTD